MVLLLQNVHPNPKSQCGPYKPDWPPTGTPRPMWKVFYLPIFKDEFKGHFIEHHQRIGPFPTIYLKMDVEN